MLAKNHFKDSVVEVIIVIIVKTMTTIIQTFSSRHNIITFEAVTVTDHKGHRIPLLHV